MSPPRPRASEPSTSTASLAQTVRRRSVEAFEATTGMPSLMAVDESIMRWLGMVRVRQHYPINQANGCRRQTIFHPLILQLLFGGR